MQRGASEWAKGGSRPQPLSGCSGKEARECRDAIGIEGIEGPAERVIVEMAGLHAWGNEPRERLMLEKMGDEVELLMNKAQTIEDHGLDRMASGHNPQCRVLLGGFVNDLGDTEFFKHACDKAQGIQDLCA